MIDVIKLLKKNKDITDYRTVASKVKTYEAFFVLGKLETVRSAAYTDVQATVYRDIDGAKGESSFAVCSSSTEREVEEKIAAAANRAKLALNEPYEIPSGDRLVGEVPSNIPNYEPRELAAKIAAAVKKADAYEKGSINALEIFIYRREINVKNGRGIDKTEVKYDAMVEAIPTWNDGDESVELYESYWFTDFDEEAVIKEIDSKLREVRDRREAKKPAEKITAKVVLNAKEAAELFTEIASDLNYATAYSHSNYKNVGDFWQSGDEGDKLTVTMKGSAKGSRYSAVFDADGVTLVDRKIIENGKVVARYGSNRFASYLGETPTGNLACVEVEKGSLTETKLKSEPYLECVSLSGLQIDLYNDYIGGEIRLAYYFDGQKTFPVTGIAMSGRLSSVLESVELSDEATTYENYRGPSKIALKGLEIL